MDLGLSALSSCNQDHKIFTSYPVVLLKEPRGARAMNLLPGKWGHGATNRISQSSNSHIFWTINQLISTVAVYRRETSKNSDIDIPPNIPWITLIMKKGLKKGRWFSEIRIQKHSEPFW